MELEDGLLDEIDNYFVPFTKSKWTFEDLTGATVESRWTQDGKIVESKDGKFLVRDCGERGLAIEITILIYTPDLRQLKDHRFALHQHHVDAIEPNPDWNPKDSKSPKFRMIA